MSRVLPGDDVALEIGARVAQLGLAAAQSLGEIAQRRVELLEPVDQPARNAYGTYCTIADMTCLPAGAVLQPCGLLEIGM